MTHYVDFSLHNLFFIRLEDPSPEAVRAVKNQIGVQALISNLDLEPDLTVSYIDRFNVSLYHTVMGNAGFVNDEFYVMFGKGRKIYRALFPFEKLGQPCKMICEEGITEIPLLNLVINLRMLAKGLMPIHASGFVYNGVGVLVNGWPSGGKTSTLFSYLTHGARFVSDDWLFVDSKSMVYGLKQPIKLSDWQLDQLPDYKTKVKLFKQWLIRTLQWVDAVEQHVPETARVKFLPAKIFYRGLRQLGKSQRHVVLLPENLFGVDLGAPVGQFDVLLLTLSHEVSKVEINPLSVDIALERILAALHYEWIQWEEYYAQYLYAFPHRRNNMMDTSWEQQKTLLENILAGKHLFSVDHPHPVKLDDLYNAVNRELARFENDDELPARP